MKQMHDGERVREALTDSPLSAAELGRRMGLAEKQVYRLLKTRHWYTDQLAKAGEVLGCDFFAAYHAALGMQPRMVRAIVVDPTVLFNEQSRLRAIEELRVWMDET